MHGTLKVNSPSVQTGWYTADLTHKASGIGYVAFCKAQKQWGDVATGTLTVSFPIAFSSAAYFCTGVEYGSGSVANNTFAPKTVNKTQVEFSNAGREKKYIVAGK